MRLIGKFLKAKQLYALFALRSWLVIPGPPRRARDLLFRFCWRLEAGGWWLDLADNRPLTTIWLRRADLQKSDIYL